MQDIDFDEIDRAVSSITDPKTNSETKAAEPFAPVPETPVTPETPSVSPAVRRSSGRFMDVVHPSSDMRPASRPSEQSVSSFQRVEVAPRDAVAERPKPIIAATTAFHWPDPIDLVPPTTEPTVEIPAADFTPEAVPEQEEAIELAEPNSPLESPFLTDAKVEKRPLGAFSGADVDLPLIEDPFPVFTDVNESAESPVQAAPPTHVPPELHEEVLLLEAHNEDEAESVNVEAMTIDSIEATAVSTISETPAVIGPTSITQQYTEQPSTTSQSSGSIYDTEPYHQPLKKPVKKHSAAIVIVWVVGLILAGGGIGAALYFFVLPLLG